MVKIILTLLFVLSYSFFANADSPKIYRLNGASLESGKFSKIYKAIADQHLAQESSGMGIKVSQHIKGTRYLAYISIKMIRSGEAGEFKETSATDEPIVIDLRKSSAGKILTDGTKLVVLASKMESPYQYTSVAGAKRTVAQYQEYVSYPYSKKQVFDMLKQGKVFMARTAPKDVKCKECGGWGTVSVNLTRVKCKECKGKGTSKKIKLFKVTW